MIVKTKGIVLNYIKYRDTSIIVKIFTEERGLGSFIVHAIRSQRSKKSIGHFQPFTVLELILYIKESRDLHPISNFRIYFPLHHLHLNFIKGAIILFLSEVLTKLLQSEPSTNPNLYHFIESSIRDFDQLTSGIENFHLQFLMKIATHLGLAIERAEVIFASTDQLMPHSKHEHVWEQLIREPYGCAIKLNQSLRNQIIDALIDYYHHHANLTKPRSLEVLRRTLN